MKLGPGVRIDKTKLLAAMDEKRRAEGLSIIAASLDAGLSSEEPWKRISRGVGCHPDNFVRILCWLGTTDVRPYLMLDPKGDEGW